MTVGHVCEEHDAVVGDPDDGNFCDNAKIKVYAATIDPIDGAPRKARLDYRSAD